MSSSTSVLFKKCLLGSLCFTHKCDKVILILDLDEHNIRVHLNKGTMYADTLCDVCNNYIHIVLIQLFASRRVSCVHRITTRRIHLIRLSDIRVHPER